MINGQMRNSAARVLGDQPASQTNGVVRQWMCTAEAGEDLPEDAGGEALRTIDMLDGYDDNSFDDQEKKRNIGNTETNATEAECT